MITHYLEQLAQTQQAARCMAVCRQCADFNPRVGIVPFGNKAARERWLFTHRAEQPDHAVIRLSGWPPPAEALRDAALIEDRGRIDSPTRRDSYVTVG